MNKHRIAKVGIILSAVVALSACAGPLPSDYNGEAIIVHPIRTKHNCSLKVVIPNGVEAQINVGAAMLCNGLDKGETVKIVNGRYAK